MAVEEFKKKLHDLYLSTESPPQYTKIQDNIREIILSDRIRGDGENMQAKDWPKKSGVAFVSSSFGT
jgi:hypothetical protein